jgi:hypothetical protein
MPDWLVRSEKYWKVHEITSLKKTHREIEENRRGCRVCENRLRLARGL